MAAWSSTCGPAPRTGEPGRPFERDTATVIFSCTKGVMAVCAYLLVQEGRLDLDSPIARYWPEFAQARQGARSRCRDAMAHRAGLSYLDTDLTARGRRGLGAGHPGHRDPAPALVARATGTRITPSTIGWLLGEVIRRITGLTAGTYFRPALGDPLGLAHVDRPAGDRSADRVAWMEPPLPDEDSEMAQGFAALGDEPHLVRAMSLGRAFAFPAANGSVTFNDPRIQASEIPGAGGHQQRRVARHVCTRRA